ncbi:hypothetical protein DSO57_1010035 [Entomophthora muscae]|uniref:Uncharacterized protein n=1 Tax=Entomophthora muscae TaxID=34485 RepID=A0ACC2RXV7_9FUNG|nr:hypothetical protein DSO57_1010035 [Entomophthora muscae]
MRLLPAVSSTPWRVVPKGGRHIKGHFIPEGVLRCFLLTDHQKSGMNPTYSSLNGGKTSNPGGQLHPIPVWSSSLPRKILINSLALLELRLILVNIMKKFRLTLPKDMEEIEFDSFPTLKPRSN